MALSPLEKRMAELEGQLAELRKTLANGRKRKDWQSTIGVFSGDETMKRIDAAALKYREENRRQGRRRGSKRNVKK